MKTAYLLLGLIIGAALFGKPRPAATEVHHHYAPAPAEVTWPQITFTPAGIL